MIITDGNRVFTIDAMQYRWVQHGYFYLLYMSREGQPASGQPPTPASAVSGVSLVRGAARPPCPDVSLALRAWIPLMGVADDVPLWTALIGLERSPRWFKLGSGLFIGQYLNNPSALI